MAIKTEMFVLTDATNNNNKFWEVTLLEDGTVKSRYGRVGSAGASNVLGSGENLYASKVREKERKGYRKVDVVSGSSGGGTVAANVAQIAKDEIANADPVVASLIERLAKINKHQIFQATGGQMDVDLDTGIIRTPVGVVSEGNVTAARVILPELDEMVVKGDVDSNTFRSKLNDYLMLIPQKVGSRQGWHKDVLPDHAAVIKQNALLDQLEASIEIAQKKISDASKIAAGDRPRTFDVHLKVLTGPETDRITQYYKHTINSRHGSAKLTPKRFFSVEIASMRKAWEADGMRLDNQMELWHGTRAHNLLSILKGGLIVPKSGGSINVTGRMFGDGLYFSDQSTKALNYAHGYWDGGSRDNLCYMFLADIGMGKQYQPQRPFSGVPPKGYDSTNVRGGTAGVLNNEMIVYRTGQANLKYLIEFGS